ncbi:S1C family serine protease [Alkalinema pantanalense CENA528]|uniref:S1C family serine protease n=1 Tax=Alkalinema pantanalense TaxID=1620705 RepID=UPI003D6F9864
MKSPVVSRFSSRLVVSGLLAVQTFLGTIAVQELALMDTNLKTGYAAQAKDNADAAQVYEKSKDAIVRIESQTKQGTATGSGVIIEKDGLIITNAHVVAGATNITVKLENGRQVKATVVSTGKSGCLDLALLQLSGMQNLPTLKVAPLTSIAPGQSVFAIGFPLGMPSASITQGIVSNLHTQLGFVQHDAPINNGNSGGALVNSRGELVGINTLKLRDREGMSFAHSVDRIQAVIQAAKNGLSPTLARYMSLTSGDATQLVADRNSINGRLQSNDQRMCIDDSMADVYTFQGRVNQPVIFEMNGETIRPYLLLLGPNGHKLAETSIQGNAKIQKLYANLPSDGTYTIIANAQKANQLGNYSIRAVTPILLRTGELGAGDPTLSSGSPYRTYHFSGKAGQPVQINLGTQEFQPLVILLDDKGKLLWQGQLQSEKSLNYKLPADGMYQIVVTTENPQSSGRFILSVEPQSASPQVVSRN